MNTTVLTPVRLWQDYDAESCALEPSFLTYEKRDDLTYFEAYITAFTEADGKARAFVRGYIPEGKNPPCLVIADDARYSTVKDEYMRDLASRGVLTVTFDYNGSSSERSEHSHYPESIAYANYRADEERLFKAFPTSYDTCMYHWVRICHRVITFTRTLSASKKLCLTGYGLGADITWLTAAFDKRVSCIAPIQSAGWHEVKNMPKYAGEDGDLVLSEEREAWVIGYGAQTYAKYVSCPVLYLGTTNSRFSPMDRVESTLKVIESPVYRFYDAGRTTAFSTDALSVLARWNAWQLTGDKPCCKPPELTYLGEGGAFEFKLVNARKVLELQLFYAYDEVHSDLRHWRSADVTPAGKGKAEVPVYEGTEMIFAFLRAKYDGGEIFCSPMQAVKPAGGERMTCRNTRILYDKRHPLDDWTVTGFHGLVNKFEPKLEAGGLDILGLTADGGDLTTFAVGDFNMRKEPDTMLRFDAYCEKDREVSIELTAMKDKVPVIYRSSVYTHAGEWTSCTRAASDFKDEKLIALKSWDEVKRLTVNDIGGVMLNNVLWT